VVTILSKTASLSALLLLGMGLCVSSTRASELSGVVTLTSQYIYRGLAFSDGNAALQLGGDYQHDSGFFVGAWATTIDLSSAGSRRDVELDYYAGYRLAPESPWSASLTVLRYTYPGAEGAQSYDYNEVLLGASWRDRYSIELGYTNDVYGLDRIGRHWEIRTEWPIANVWVIGGRLGGNDLSGLNISHFLHWDLGASARISRFTFDLRWYDNEIPDYMPISSLSAGSQIVLSVSLGL